MTVELNRVFAFVRNLAGYAAIVLGSIPVTDLPASIRVPLVATGGALLTAEHGIQSILGYIEKVRTGPGGAAEPAPPAATTSAPATPAAANPFAPTGTSS